MSNPSISVIAVMASFLMLAGMIGCDAAPESSTDEQASSEAVAPPMPPADVHLPAAADLDAVISNHPVTLAAVWAPACGLCMHEAIALSEAIEAGELEGIQVIGLGWTPNLAEVAEFRRAVAETQERQEPVPYQMFAADWVGERYPVDGTPTLLLLDAQGELQERFEPIGFEESSVEAAIAAAQELRQAAKASTPTQ